MSLSQQAGPQVEEVGPGEAFRVPDDCILALQQGLQVQRWTHVQAASVVLISQQEQGGPT